jgi:acyl carrier protein
MDTATAKAAVRSAIITVAPDAPLDELDDGDDLFEVLEIDSMDLLNIVVDVHQRTGIDVPERDYGKLRTLADFADYLVAHAPA